MKGKEKSDKMYVKKSKQNQFIKIQLVNIFSRLGFKL